MAEWKRKVQRALKDELRPGEDVQAAVFLQPHGSTARAIARGDGGSIGAAVADRLDHPKPTAGTRSDNGLAATLPGTSTVIALTTQRLLALGHSSLTGRPKGIIATLAPNDLVGIEFEDHGATSLVVMHLSDGTARVYEAPRLNNDVRTFAELVNTR